MKNFYTAIALLITSVMLTAGLASCEFDSSNEPDFPIYVSYTISAGYVNYNGPQELINEFQAWLRENSSVYDEPVKYTTGEASEFTKTDNKAIEKYNTFVSNFKIFLEEAKAKLASGAYGSVTSASGTFYLFAHRTQGQDGDLRYEQIEFVYPDSSTPQ